MTTATTIGGWALLFGVGGAYYYVTQNSKKKQPTVPNKQSSKMVEPKKENKAKKARGSGDEKKAMKKKPESAKEDKAFSAPVSSATEDRDEIDDREFARQLSQAKTGTLSASKSQTESRPKSIKQTMAQEKKKNIETSSDNATAPSSTTGGDADDDQSPINSPKLGATAVSGDVSDMIEKSAQGPSVLRVTEPTKPVQQKKGNALGNVETAETKKQRQNKKKAEEKKLAREQDEKVRQSLLEKQRRIAREAEGRAAKDGSAFMASKAPTSSAWTAPATTTNGYSVASKSTELLDTYETPVKQIETKVPESKLDNIPAMSEEEQMAIAVDASQNWETVKTAKRKTKKENVPLSDGKQSSADEKDFQPPKVIPPTGPGQKWKSELVHVDDNGNVHETSMLLQDSEWEVA